MSLITKSRFVFAAVATVAVAAVGTFAYAQTNTDTSTRPQRATTAYNMNDAAAAAAAASAANVIVPSTPVVMRPAMPAASDGMQPYTPSYRNDMPNGQGQTMPNDPSGMMRTDPTRAGTLNGSEAPLAPRADRN
jgi:hypothetical protein